MTGAGKMAALAAAGFLSHTGCAEFNLECTPNVKDAEGLAGYLDKAGAPVSLEKIDVRTDDHALGQLLAESYFFAYDGVERDPNKFPRIGVENSGAIRAECRNTLPAGRIPRKWLRQVIPFDNQIYVTPMSVDQVRRMFEHSVAGFQAAPNPANRSPPGAFLQIYGVTLEVDCLKQIEELNADGSVKTAGQRVRKLRRLVRTDPSTADCVIDFEAGTNSCGVAELWVAVNSFLYGGGDDYQVFKEIANGPRKDERLSAGVLNFNVAATHWAERYGVPERPFPAKPAARHTFLNCVRR